MTRALVIAAFDMAVWSRNIAAGLLFHSDQGSQFASDDFVDLIGVFALTQRLRCFTTGSVCTRRSTTQRLLSMNNSMLSNLSKGMA
jgi:hypothetical protein